MRNCDIEIKIGTADKISLVQAYDFHLIESPARIVPPIRDYEKQQYPESSTPEIDARTIIQPFDYKISLGYWGKEENANGNIRAFFNSLFKSDDTVADSEIMVAEEIELFNNYKGVKMKGYAKKWDEKTYTIEGENGLVLFDFILYVNDPSTLTDIPHDNTI